MMLTLEELEDFFGIMEVKKVWVFSKDMDLRVYYMKSLKQLKTSSSALEIVWTMDLFSAVHFQTEGAAKMHKDNFFIDRDDISIVERTIDL